MDSLPPVALDVLWSIISTEGLMRAIAVCTQWRYSIISFWERRGLYIDASEWGADDNSLELPAAECRLRAVLSHLLPRMRKLKRLVICKCFLSDKIDLGLVSQSCPDLEAISLEPFNVNVDSVQELCQRCPQLKEVTMPKEEVEEGCLVAVLRALSELTILETGHEELTDEEVSLLPSTLRKLSCVSVEEALEERLNTDLHNIADLNVYFMTQGSLDLSGCSSLKSLYVQTGHYDIKMPRSIRHVLHGNLSYELDEGRHPELETLVLFFEPSRKTLEKIMDLTSVNAVKLAKIKLSRSILDQWLGLSHIKELHLDDVNLGALLRPSQNPGRTERKEEDDDGAAWMAVADLAVCVASLVVIGVFNCVPSDISEGQFKEMGCLLQKGRRLTLYTHLEYSSGGAEPAWGYNLDPTGRLRIKGEADWQREFPHLIDREE